MAEIPCRHAVISASHNISKKSQSKVDKNTRKKAAKYLKQNSDFRNYKFQRVAGTEIDELKFLMPVVGHVPSVVFQIVYAAMNKIRASIVGSDQVGRVLEAVKESGVLPGASLDDLVHVHEGKHTSLRSSINNGWAGLEIDDDVPFLFISADLPFAFDYRRHLDDPDWENHIAILNFNSRQSIFKGNDFFSRNYYQVFMEGTREFEVKEPNIWQLTGKSIKGIDDYIDVFYSNRNGGGFSLPRVIWHGPGKYLKAVKGLKPEQRKEMNHCLYTFMTRSFGSKGKDQAQFSTLDAFASVLFDGPVKVKAHHNNPWMLRDIDAWHDLFFYQQVVDHALDFYNVKNFGELTRLNPYAEQIWALEPVLTEVGQEMPIIGSFKDYANMRTSSLGFGPVYKKGQLMVSPTPAENLDVARMNLAMLTTKYLGITQPLRTGESQRSYQGPEAEPLPASQ